MTGSRRRRSSRSRARWSRPTRSWARSLKVVPIDQDDRLLRATAASIGRISAEAGTKHGFNPTVVIFDELAQAKSRDLYDVLDTSFGARAEPLFITISTQSNDPEHVLSKLIDDGLAGNRSEHRLPPLCGR